MVCASTGALSTVRADAPHPRSHVALPMLCHLLMLTMALGELILRVSLVDRLIFVLLRTPLKREAWLTHSAPFSVRMQVA